MVVVKNPPFHRKRWTHVAFCWEHFDGTDQGSTRLYLNGKPVGSLSRPQQLTWDANRVVIMIGINYVGWLDDLMIFDRPLAPQEVADLAAGRVPKWPQMFPKATGGP